MEDNTELVIIILAELIESMGGVVQLDATKILADLKDGRFKEITMRLVEGVAILEVFDANED